MKIGDKVSVLDEDLQGVVASVQGEMVNIRDEYGFIHQYAKEKLVLKDSTLYDGMKIKDKYEYMPPKSKKHSKNEFILDLHFDKIVSNPEGYESFERLFLQKEKLLETLDFCRENRIKRLQIIHGLGDGVLQEMVYNVLRGYAGIDFEENDFFKHSSASVEVFINNL